MAAPMTTWIYLATDARASEADAFRFALKDNILPRSPRTKDGELVANVARLRAGDDILLACRSNGPLVARVRATIAAPSTPVDGTQVVERIAGEHAAALVAAGYPARPDGAVEVIHLTHLKAVELPLAGAYAGQNAIHRSKEDVAPAAQAPGPRLKASAPAPTEPTAAPLTLETQTRTAFDAYVMVDWSSSAIPCTGADSIWIASGEREGKSLRESWDNPRTRQDALALLRRILGRFVMQGRRVLVGMDFAFGYPRGFAQALGLQGPPWRAVLEHFGERVTDDIRNAHNRDAFAAACNVKISEGPGPFWGCRNAAASANLTTRRVGVFTFPHHGLAEWRETDRRLRGVQSVWKLNQGVAVGGQTILGLKYLHDLRFKSDPKLSAALRIWPFETGWQMGGAQVVVCEIFPSATTLEDGLGAVRDLTQVRSCVRAAARQDDVGELVGRLRRPEGLTAADEAAVLQEEGWILPS
jgi:hypothetical protein